MNKKEFILAAFAPAKCEYHSPVQAQKLIFIIDRQMSPINEGSGFDFQPYNYGPFDKAVYEELESLASEGLVSITQHGTWKSFRLTDKGQIRGDEILKTLQPKTQDYYKKVSEFVRSLSFQQLVSSVYKAYPEMRTNSIFQG